MLLSQLVLSRVNVSAKFSYLTVQFMVVTEPLYSIDPVRRGCSLQERQKWNETELAAGTAWLPRGPVIYHGRCYSLAIVAS
jgi:hypothetical protein